MGRSLLRLSSPCLICRRYDLHMHVEEVVAKNTGKIYTRRYTRGLPIGLKLSNGFTVGDEDWFCAELGGTKI